MGEVWGYDPDEVFIWQLVAVKLIPPGLSTKSVKIRSDFAPAVDCLSVKELRTEMLGDDSLWVVELSGVNGYPDFRIQDLFEGQHAGGYLLRVTPVESFSTDRHLVTRQRINQ